MSALASRHVWKVFGFCALALSGCGQSDPTSSAPQASSQPKKNQRQAARAADPQSDKLKAGAPKAAGKNADTTKAADPKASPRREDSKKSEESKDEKTASGKPKADESKITDLKARERMPFLTFDGPAVPVNKDGKTYPTYYDPKGRKEGGVFTLSLNAKDSISGNSLQLDLTEGALYAQFNPYAGVIRGFARDYCAAPAEWKFDTYNRLRFWMKAPVTAPPHKTTGQGNYEFALFCKRVEKPDNYSDETGGGHFYHLLNVPALEQWTQVILNMHPSHIRGASGGQEHGNLTHPTGEIKYNYFDTLTRFYIQCTQPPSKYPAHYLFDEFEFFRQSEQENDDQVYSISGTYVPERNRIILTWCRNKDENGTEHEVRYGFENIHAVGWEKAKAAPDGVVKPLGDQGYNNMVYDSTALPLQDRSVVFLAIKPRNAKLFSQISVPLTRRN